MNTNRPARRRFARAIGAVLAFSGVGSFACGAAYWDPLQTPTNPHDGSGTWDLNTTANWSDGSSDHTWQYFDASTIPTFGDNNGMAGTVNLVSSVPALGINFNAVGSGNYTISSSDSSSINFGNSPFVVTTAAGVSPTLAVSLTGGQTFVSTGAGTLNLSGMNTYSGGTNVTGGVLNVLSPLALGSGIVNVSATGTLAVNTNAILSASVNNSGLFNIAAGQTFNFSSTSAIFNQAGGTLNINGTLAVNTFNYSGGTVNGTVLFNSSSGTSTLNLGTGISTGNFLFTGGYGYLNANASTGIPAGISLTVHPAMNNTQGELYSNTSLINNGVIALISSPNSSVYLSTNGLFTNNAQFSISPGGAQYPGGDYLYNTVLNNAPGTFSLNANTSSGYNVNNLGTFNIAVGQTFNFSSTSAIFNQAGGTLNINGTLAVNTFNYSGGTVNGTVLFNSSSGISTLNLGTGISTGNFLFTGGYGYVNANASTGIPAGISLTVHPAMNNTQGELYSSTSLINNGVIALISSPNSSMYLSTNGLFTNNAQFSISPGGAQYPGGDYLYNTVLNNAPGTFSLNANTSSGYNVNNLGTFNIAAGQTFNFSSTSAIFNQAGGTLNINGTLAVNTFNYSGGTVNGTVLFNSSSGTSTLNLGTGISTGNFLFTGGYGYVNANASTGIPAGISLTVHPAMNNTQGELYSNTSLINNGVIALISSPNSSMYLSTNGLFTNNAQFSISPGGAQYPGGDYLYNTVLNNAPGTFSLNANTSSGYNVNNLGTFNIAAGQTFNFSSTSAIFNQAGGTLNINGTLAVNTFNYSGGAVNGTVLFNSTSGTSTLNLGTGISTGNFLFTGGYGYVNANASTGIPAGISLTVHPAMNNTQGELYSNTSLINNGVIALISSPNSSIYLSTNGLFTNNAQFSISPGGAQYPGGDYLYNTVLNNAPGTFSLNANTSSGYNVNNLGTFNIAVGQNLSFSSSSAGFNQAGGTLNVPGNYYVGGTPTTANGDGFLNVSGGSIVVNGTLKIWNSTEALTLNGGSVTTGILDTSGVPGNLHWTGGTLTINGSNPIIDTAATAPFGSAFNISSGMTFVVGGGNNELIGVNGIAVVTQTGGSHVVTGSLNLGTTASGSGVVGGTGNYMLTGTGLLSAPTELVGTAGTGYFNQTGGTNTVTSLAIATQSTAQGTYQLYTGGNLTVTSAAYVGESGNGTFLQSAGTASIQELDLGTAPGGVGVAYLVGGTTNVPGNVNVGGLAGTAGGKGVLDVYTSGSLNVSGAITVFDSSANGMNLTGGGVVSTQSLTLLGGSSSVGSGSTLTIGAGGLTFGGNDSPSINTASGTLVLNGDVLFNGSTGTADIYSSGSGSIDLGGGNRTFNVYASASNISMLVASNLTDGALVKTGPGTLLISGSNTYAGSTNVLAGTLELGSSLAVNRSSGIVVSPGATLDLDGQTIGTTPLALDSTGVAGAGALINSNSATANFAGPITLSSTLGNAVALGGSGGMNLSGGISGPAGISKIGFNTVTLAGGGNFTGGIVVNSGTLAITAPTSFTGGISLVGGTLAIQADNDLGDSGNGIVLSTGGTLEALAGGSPIVSSRSVTAAGGTLQVDTNQTFTLNGQLLGAGPLNKSGGGILRLTSSSSLNGAINISAGTLSLAGSAGALPSVSSIGVMTTGILELNSADALGGNQLTQDRVSDRASITLAGGTLSMQGSSSALTTELLGQLNLQAGASTIAVNAGTAQSAYLSFTSMGGRALGGTLAFNAPDLGNTDRVYFNTGYSEGQHLGGWATVNGTDFAKYSSSLGVVAFNQSDYTYNAFTPGADVQLNSLWSGTVPTVSISTLNLNSSTGLAVNQTGTLTLSSGGLLKQGPGNANITGGVITTNPGASSELDVSVNGLGSTLEISSQLSGQFVLTERGNGTLLLDGPAANSYTGFTLVSGNLQLNSSGGTAIQGAFELDGGSLLSLASGQFDKGSTITINSGSWNLNHQTENITTLTVNNGLMQFSGGTLNVSNGVYLNGGTTIIASTLNSNQVTVSGGTNVFDGLVTEGTLTFLGLNPAVQVASDNTTPGKLILTGSGTLAFAGSGTASLVSTGNGTQAGILDLNGSNGHMVNVSAPGTTMLISTQIVNGGFNYSGPGTLELTASNTYSGGTTITGTGSTLVAANLFALGANGSAGATVTFAGGTLALRSDSASASYAVNGGVASAGTTVGINIDRLTPIAGTPAGTFSLNTLTVGSGSAAFNVVGNDGGTLLIGSSGQGMTMLANGGPAIFNMSANVTVNGPLVQSGGSVGLAKTGVGTLSLSGTGNNVFGATNVSGGTLLLNKTSAYAIPSDLIINNGSVVRFQQSNQIISTSAITINAAAGLSLLDLNGNNNLFAGGITFQAGGGTLSTGAGTAVLASDVNFVAGTASTVPALITGNLNLSGGTRTFNVQSAGGTVDMEIDATLTGNSTGLTKAGTGTLFLKGVNTFTGPIQVTGGILEVNSAASLGSTSNVVTLAGGTLQFANAFDPSTNAIAVPAASSVDTEGNLIPVAGAINGAGSLTKLGTGTLALKGSNGFSGGLAIDAGIVQVSSDANLGAAGMPVTLAGGTLNVTGSINSSRLFSTILGGGTLNASTGTVTLTNAANFSANLTLTAGTLYLNESSGTPVVSNAAPVSITVMPGAGLIDGGPIDALKGAASGAVVNVVDNSVIGFNVANGAKTTGYISGSGNTNVSPGSSLTASYIRQSNLYEYGNVNISPQLGTHNGSSTVSVIGTLTSPGQPGNWQNKLDLANNDLIVQSGSLALLTSQIQEGYAGGAWNGAGGIVSSSSANDASHLTTLGILQNNQAGVPLYGSGAVTALFDGQSPNPSDILIKYTYYGDANLDGKVDASDYSRIDSGFLTGATGWFNGDFNYDGVINGSDYTLIDNAFNTQGASLTSQVAVESADLNTQISGLAGVSAGVSAGTPAGVPEPAMIGITLVGAMGMLGRRGRRGPC